VCEFDVLRVYIMVISDYQCMVLFKSRIPEGIPGKAFLKVTRIAITQAVIYGFMGGMTTNRGVM